MSQDIQNLLDKGSEYSLSYNEDIEFNFYENVSGNIIGYQLGQNLNYLGVSLNSTIFFDNRLNNSYSVSLNSSVRKIVFRPHSSIVFKKSDASVVSDNQCLIQINSHNGVSENIIVDSFSGENFKSSDL